MSISIIIIIILHQPSSYIVIAVVSGYSALQLMRFTATLLDHCVGDCPERINMLLSNSYMNGGETALCVPES